MSELTRVARAAEPARRALTAEARVEICADAAVAAWVVGALGSCHLVRILELVVVLIIVVAIHVCHKHKS